MTTELASEPTQLEQKLSAPLAKVVWIIDDNEVDVFTIGKMFEHFLPTCNLQYFYSAQRAITHLALEPSVAVILLDIDMPVFNGWDFLDSIRLLDVACPIYILTSSSDERDRIKASGFQVKGFFSKPLTRENILTVAEECGLI
jgi:CheY-like chemotaxis protein